MILLIFLIQIQNPTVVWERLMVGLISYREVTDWHIKKKSNPAICTAEYLTATDNMVDINKSIAL